MNKGGLFSDREWTEIARNYRNARWMTKARIWGLVSLAAAIATVTVLTIVWVVGAAFSEKPDLDASHTSVAPAHPKPSPSGTFDYDIEGINVTFGAKNNSRVAYAQFSLVVQCPNEECLTWMKLNRASLRDAVYTVSMRQHIENFKSASGVENFKAAILEEFQRRFPAQKPKSLLIRDWFLR